MKVIYNSLKFQDYFYVTFLHEFKGEKKKHSYISVFLSFIVNIICITLLIINVIHLFKRKEPSISYSKIDLLKGVNITLNTKDLLFSVFLRDKNHIPLNNPSLITINAVYKILQKNKENGNLNSKEYNLDIVNCTNFYNKYQKLEIDKQFKENDIRLHYCFNDSKKKIIIGGRYSDDFYGTLSINISKCENKSNSNIICESEDKINEKIQGSWLQIFYSTNSINSENFSFPVNTELTSYYLKLDHSLNKQIYTYFNSLDFSSNDNLIFDKYYKKKTIIKLDETKNDIIYQNEDKFLSTIYVCSSMNKEKIQRRYIKIQEVGASIYGIFMVQCIIVYIILYVPQLKIMDIEILNVLFDYKPKYFNNKKKNNEKLNMDKYTYSNKNNQQIKFNPIPIIKTITFTKNSNYNNINNKTNINHIHKKKINICDIIKIYLCLFNSKYKKVRDEMNFLMKEKRRYTDLSESLKIFLFTEKIKEIIINKGIADENNFSFHKKLLRYDSHFCLKSNEGKMTSTIYKETNNRDKNLNSDFILDKKNNLSNEFVINENSNQNIIN